MQRPLLINDSQMRSLDVLVPSLRMLQLQLLLQLLFLLLLLLLLPNVQHLCAELD